MNIISELSNLTYVTEEFNNSLTEKLNSIDSSIQTNNLLNTIQTYQLYKINKQSKGLTN